MLKILEFLWFFFFLLRISNKKMSRRHIQIRKISKNLRSVYSSKSGDFMNKLNYTFVNSLSNKIFESVFESFKVGSGHF